MCDVRDQGADSSRGIGADLAQGGRGVAKWADMVASLEGVGGAVSPSRVERGRPVWARSYGWAICQVEAWGRGLVRPLRGRGLAAGLAGCSRSVGRWPLRC